MKKINPWFLAFLFLISNLTTYKLLCTDPWDVNKIIVDGGKKEWIKLSPGQKMAVCLESARRMRRHSLESELYLQMIDKAYAEPEFEEIKLCVLIPKSVVAITKVEMLMHRYEDFEDFYKDHKEDLPDLNGLPKPDSSKPKFIDPTSSLNRNI